MERKIVLDIFEYIDEIGKFTIEEKPFNNVDSLLISQLSYMKLDAHVPTEAESAKGISLEDINKSENVELLFRDERNYEINKYYFEKLANSERFKHLILRDFLEVVNVEAEVQFCAMTAVFENGLTYVVYRGTDEHMVGWKEDFNMIYKTPVPAQRMAVKYLTTVAKRIKTDFYVGGHSKGGNLAVYAAVEASSGIKNRIIKVFSHDGPGFNLNFISKPEYKAISSKIVKQVPKSSIFGMMLFTPDTYDIIISKDKGVEQHNPYNWLTDGEDFIYADKMDKAYLLEQKVFNTWTSEITDEQAALIGNTLFDFFEQAGVDTINDVYSMRKMFSAASEIYEAYKNLDPDIKQKFDEVIEIYRHIMNDLRHEMVIQDVESLGERTAEGVQNVISSIKNAVENRHDSEYVESAAENVAETVEKALDSAKLSAKSKDNTAKEISKKLKRKGRLKKKDDK